MRQYEQELILYTQECFKHLTQCPDVDKQSIKDIMFASTLLLVSCEPGNVTTANAIAKIYHIEAISFAIAAFIYYRRNRLTQNLTLTCILVILVSAALAWKTEKEKQQEQEKYNSQIQKIQDDLFDTLKKCSAADMHDIAELYNKNKPQNEESALQMIQDIISRYSQSTY